MPRRKWREAWRERPHLRHSDDFLQERQPPVEDRRENESLHRLHQHVNGWWCSWCCRCGSPSHLVRVEPPAHLLVKGDLVRVTRPVVGRDLATPAIHHHVFTHRDAACGCCSPSHLVGVEPPAHLPVVKGDLVRVAGPVVGRDLATPAIHHHVFTYHDAACGCWCCSPSHLVGVEPSAHFLVKGDLVRVTSPVVGRDLATPAIHYYVFPHPDAAICVVIRH